MAGYRRVILGGVDEKGVVHLGFFREVKEIGGNKYPFYDDKTIDKNTAEKLYNELKKFYEVKEPN